MQFLLHIPRSRVLLLPQNNKTSTQSSFRFLLHISSSTQSTCNSFLTSPKPHSTQVNSFCKSSTKSSIRFLLHISKTSTQINSIHIFKVQLNSPFRSPLTFSNPHPHPKTHFTQFIIQLPSSDSIFINSFFTFSNPHSILNSLLNPQSSLDPQSILLTLRFPTQYQPNLERFHHCSSSRLKAPIPTGALWSHSNDESFISRSIPIQ